MSIRMYIAPQEEWATPFGFTAWRSIICGLIDANATDIGEIDHPARRYSVMVIVASDATHANIAADARVTPVTPLCANMQEFNAALDAPFSSYSLAWRNAAKAKLESLGINTAWIGAGNSLYDVLRYMIRIHQLSQRLDGQGESLVKQLFAQSLDTTWGSLPANVRSRVAAWAAEKGVTNSGVTASTTMREILHYIVERYLPTSNRIGGRDF